MSIGNIIKIKQPDVYKQLLKMTNKNKPNKIKRTDDDLSFDDFARMMHHDSYKKVRGSIRQVRHG